MGVFWVFCWLLQVVCAVRLARGDSHLPKEHVESPGVLLQVGSARFKIRERVERTRTALQSRTLAQQKTMAKAAITQKALLALASSQEALAKTAANQASTTTPNQQSSSTSSSSIGYQTTEKVVGRIRCDAIKSTTELTRCMGVRCSYKNKDTPRGKALRLQGTTMNAVCITVCETIEDQPNYWQNRMWYDYYGKQVHVYMDGKEKEDWCWEMDLNGVLIANLCDPNNLDRQKFDYDPGTKQFYQAGKCLEMIFTKEKGRSKNDTQPGGLLNGCDPDLETQKFTLPKKTAEGALDQSMQEEAERKKDPYKRPCNTRLGVSDPSRAFFYPLIASSERPDANASAGRLYQQTNGWCPIVSDASQWLQVSFNELTQVGAFEVQAGHWNPAKYVKKLRIRYRQVPENAKDPSDLMWADYLGGVEFDVDTKGIQDRVIKVTLSPALSAKAIQFMPTSWETEICMRIELFGCASWKGEAGCEGDQGTKGPQGRPGPPGLDGEPGENAEKGEIGNPGPQGSPGGPGLTGLPGAKGPTGENGTAGSIGLQGPPGWDGYAGAQGDRGNPGAMGPPGKKVQGKAGLLGRKGLPGPSGAAGPDGPQGKAGKDGVPGLQGAPGVWGAAAKDGPPGLQGITGYHGVPGSIGKSGVQGKPGPKGLPGDYPLWTDLDAVVRERINRVDIDLKEMAAEVDELAIDAADAVGQTVPRVLKDTNSSAG